MATIPKKAKASPGQYITLLSGYRFMTEMPRQEMMLGAQELAKMNMALCDKIDAYTNAVVEMVIALGVRPKRDQLDDLCFYFGSMLKASAFLAIKDKYKIALAKRSQSSEWAQIARPPENSDPRYDDFVRLENAFDIRESQRHKYPFMNALFEPQNFLGRIIENEYLPRYLEIGLRKPIPFEFSSKEQMAARMAKYKEEASEISALCVPFQEEILVMLHDSINRNAHKKELISAAR